MTPRVSHRRSYPGPPRRLMTPGILRICDHCGNDEVMIDVGICPVCLSIDEFDDLYLAGAPEID